MNRSFIYVWLLLSLLLTSTACEKDRDFSPAFPSRAILGSGPYQGSYWPTGGWRSCAPESVGMDAELLRKMNEDMVLQMRLHIDVHSVLVIRKGYIVAEQYYSDEFSSDSLHYLFSVTKSVLSAAFGIADDQGLIPSLDTPLMNFFPDYQWENPEGKDRITLEHALTMTDGFEWYELQYLYGDDLNTFTDCMGMTSIPLPTGEGMTGAYSLSLTNPCLPHRAWPLIIIPGPLTSCPLCSSNRPV
jgi:CubicO group peptidase (beta-lactamase class C family)